MNSKKIGFFTRVFILPAVNKAIKEQLEGVNCSISRQSNEMTDLSNDIVSIRSLIDQEVKQLNEVGKADLDDREAKLVTSLSEKNEQIKSLIDKYVTLADKVERVCDSFDTVCNAVSTLRKGQHEQAANVVEALELAKTELRDAVRQSRVDTATAIKNTRDKITEVDSKLDAFIDTVSEKLAQLKRRN